jgi:hypothetical protein
MNVPEGVFHDRVWAALKDFVYGDIQRMLEELDAAHHELLDAEKCYASPNGDYYKSCQRVRAAETIYAQARANLGRAIEGE